MKKLFSIKTLCTLAIALVAPPALASAGSWDHWYTVTILPGTPYAYYRETVETRDGRIHFKTQMWKREEGYINEEQLGAFALDNDLLTPLFYNFHSTYRANEMTIDGTATETKLTIRIKKMSESQSEKPILTRTIPPKAIFSSFFPVWLRRQFSKNASQGSFTAILEDGEASGFSPATGSFKAAQPDGYSRQSGTTRFEVSFSGNRSFWYLDKPGGVARIDLPSQKSRIDRVDEATAKAFFEQAGSGSAPKKGAK